jgi:hypothetical protein
MTFNSINIEFRNVSADTTELVSFFTPIGKVNFEKTDIEAKGLVETIFIALNIVGSWAAERYLLDPIAEKFDEWIRVLSALDGKQFKVIVKFHNSSSKTFETLQISTPLILGEIWKLIKKTSGLLEKSPYKNVINRVMIVPHTTQKVLVVGYTRKQPTHILDLDNERVIPLIRDLASDKSIALLFWEIEQLALQIEHLRRLNNIGDLKVQALEKEIAEKIASCL